MIEILSMENMRKSDARTIANGVPGRDLMCRAGSESLQEARELAEAETNPVSMIAGDTVRNIPAVIPRILP